MMALLEAGVDPSDKVISNAMYCLKNSKGQSYELAVKAYALNLAKRPEGLEFLDQLMSRAITSPSGEMYWEEEGAGELQ